MTPVRTVAVMQPYFFPYAGYFRLLARADEFVIFDCVQFRRRGRIHRTQVPGPSGKPEWLTLPVDPGARETKIADVAFAADARATLNERLDRLPWIADARGAGAQRVREHLLGPLPPFLDFLEQGLRLVAELLDLQVSFSRSSALNLPPDLHGQERVLAVLERLGASRYVNLPGGRDLYAPDAFAHRGVDLEFLPDYTGPHVHMLHSMMTADLDAVRRDTVAW